METAAPPLAPDRRLTAVALVVVLGAFLSVLDTTVVTVAIDALARELEAPLATIQWVATGYLLALAATIPLTGWAADRFGAGRLFTSSVALFTAGSALAAAAWSAESLIAFRVVQGLGGGLILPAGIALVGQVAGPQRIGRAMSAIGVPMMLGPALGPVLGGGLLDAVSWRWIFLVNVPVGLLVLLLAAHLLPADPPPRPAQPLDVRGLALLSPGLAALVHGLAETASSGGLGAPRALGPLLAGIALIAAFVAHALRLGRAGASGAGASGAGASGAGASGAGAAGGVAGAATGGADPAPLLDLRLLRIPSVAASAATLLLLGAAFLGTLFLLPLCLQQVRGETALSTGLLLLPQGAGAALAMWLSGRTAERFGAGRVVTAGLAPFALALAGLTQVDESTSYLLLEAVLLLFGIGMGATMMPAMSAAYRTLEQSQVARATALLTIVQRVGSSLGVALVAVVLQRGGAQAGAFAEAFRLPLALALAAVPPAALLSRGASDRS
jgi:MFS family permease